MFVLAVCRYFENRDYSFEKMLCDGIKQIEILAEVISAFFIFIKMFCCILYGKFAIFYTGAECVVVTGR